MLKLLPHSCWTAWGRCPACNRQKEFHKSQDSQGLLTSPLAPEERGPGGGGRWGWHFRPQHPQLAGVWGCRLSPLWQAEMRKGLACVKCALLQSCTEVPVAPGDKCPQQLSASQPQPRIPFLWHPQHRKPLSAPKSQLLCFPCCAT